MEQAIAQMRLSEGKGPRVGVVIEKDGIVLAVGHRISGMHAERMALEAALKAGADLRGSTVYSTLEPCVEAGSSVDCCADLIIRSGCARVVIGRYDPNPLIYREGWKRLRDAGIALQDFPPDLRERLDQFNEHFAGHFKGGTGPTGGAKFDYLQNEGNFEVRFSPSDTRTITTRWTQCGIDAIYAYAARPLRVALARYASAFEEIDDPRALDFNHSVRVEKGKIAAFVSAEGCVLAKVIEVESGPRYGSPRTSLKIRYEVRTWA